jgi:hypothetical protein
MNQGASEISMMFGIHVDDAEKAVLSTYEFCYHGVAYSAKACVILFAVPMTLFIPSPTIIKIAKSCSILSSSTSHF